MELGYPIMRKFFYKARIIKVNQLFGDSKNTSFYDAKGHTGIDFKTTGGWKYIRDNTSATGWREVDCDKHEKQGRIPIVACHEGTVRTVLYDDKQGMGWGLYVTKDLEIEGGQMVQYRTLYWHIETPWQGLSGTYQGIIKNISQLASFFMGRKVVRGSIIGIGGDNGMSTGPHIHLSLDRRIKTLNGWSEWERIDPMPYFRDSDDIDEIVMECNYLYNKDLIDMSKVSGNNSYWLEGEQITKKQKDLILSK